MQSSLQRLAQERLGAIAADAIAPKALLRDRRRLRRHRLSCRHAADPADNILTPSQLNTLARDLLEGAFPLVWVEGELGNCRGPASGHLYFTLKDARAQVRCAMFKPKSQWLKFLPREGLRVLARGRLTLYEARGDYQLVLDHLEEAGEGALRRAFEELKAKLQAEGLFDAERKRPLPAYRAPAGRDHLAAAARRCATCSACWRGASR